MGGNEVRKKYLKFFEKRRHLIIKPAPLVLKDDLTTLFTSSGMQPLVPYLTGKEYPGGNKRLADSQPSLRVQDIEDVGDNRHTTFFEMLGNWSLGDYFKKEQLAWIWEFITKELELPQDKLYISFFEGDENIKEDNETHEIWKSLGVKNDHIFKYGVKKNWWSRSGAPSEMPDGEIGGPDSEIFFEFENIKHNPRFGKICHPNCDCGRFLEIGNSVFIQYEKKDGKLVELPQKNVDFGGGLERLIAATNNDPDVFKTDLFSKILKSIHKVSGAEYEKDSDTNLMRIIADHLKAATFIVAAGVEPSNKLQGYIVRRLLRRAAIKMRSLTNMPTTEQQFIPIVDSIVSTYENTDYFDGINTKNIKDIIGIEISRFIKTLDRGLKEFEKYKDEQLNVLNAFNLYQSYGFPFEITQELFRQKGIDLNKKDFEEVMKGHQELSRKLSSDKFKLK